MASFFKSFVQSSTQPSTSENNNQTVDGNEQKQVQIPLCPILTQEFENYNKETFENTFIGLDLQACEDNSDENSRKPLDISIVIDTSSSMYGQKLDMCKLTVEFILTQLKENDSLSLINFGDQVTTRPLKKCNEKGKKEIMKNVKSLHTQGCTNLSGGLLAGIDTLKKSKAEVQAVFLLTDGHANRGISDKNDIAQATAEAIRDLPNVRVFTFGYGADHSPEMLEEISESGRGMYYFVKNSDTVTTAFADCLGGLLSVVAQNIEITFEVDESKTNLMVTECSGSKDDAKTIEQGKKYILSMGDTYSGEKKSILVALTLPSDYNNEEVEYKIGQFTIEYVDVLNGDLRTEIVPATIRRTNDVKEKKDLTRNENMSLAISKMIATRAIDFAQHQANEDNYREAQTLVNNALNEIRSIVASVEDAEIIEEMNDLIEDLNKSLSRVTDRHTYQSYGKYDLMSRKMEMKMQRVKLQDDDLDAIMSRADDLSACASNFEGNSKMRKMKGGVRSKAITESLSFLRSNKK